MLDVINVCALFVCVWDCIKYDDDDGRGKRERELEEAAYDAVDAAQEPSY